MKTQLHELRNVIRDENIAVDLLQAPEAHGIELHEEELEPMIAPEFIHIKF